MSFAHLLSPLEKKSEENEKVTVKTSFKTVHKEFIIYFKYGGKQFLADVR